MRLSRLSAAASAPNPAPAFPGLPPPAVPDPHSVPGFLDPTTGHFTRLVPPAGAAAQPVSGEYDVVPRFQFDKAFGKLNSITCIATLYFGEYIGGVFFPPTGRADGIVQFAAGNTPNSISIPYEYTPNSPEDRAELSISCVGLDNAGAQHFANNSSEPEDLPNGNMTRSINVSF